jgi:MEKHLA domain
MSHYHLSPAAVEWTHHLLNSYRRWTGQALLAEASPLEQAKQLFEAPFAVVSHDHQADPIFNYANRAALTLWQLDWTAFTQMPSRLSAEPDHRRDRAQMLAQLEVKNFVDNYQGVRVSQQGQRFWIEQAVIWNVIDAAGNRLGQAATFAHWQFMD